MVNHTFYDPDTKTWTGLRIAPTFNKDVSVASVILHSLARSPDHIGQISDNSGVRMTNDQIRKNSIRLAINLQRGQFKISQNDVLALVSSNHEKVSCIVVAALACAAPINTLDPTFKSAEIAQILSLTRPKVVFCESKIINKVREALHIIEMSATPLVTVDRKMDNVIFIDELLGAHADEHLFVPVELADGTKQTAMIICSSGTTGASKGVRVSHALMLDQLSYSININRDDIFLSFSSLYWLSGVIALLCSLLVGNTRIITTSPFEPELLFRFVEQYGVTILITAPSHLARMLQSPAVVRTNFSTLTKYYCGGSAVPDELIVKINKLLPVGVRNTYGASESCGMVSMCESGPSGSVGTLRHNTIVRIIDDNGGRCGPMEDGEIYAYTSFPMLGYWGDEEATRDAFTEEGWFKTGDIGHFDMDGYLFLVDRKKDIMKYRNYQISPSELENVVLRCPGVAEVCAVGIPDLVSTDLPAVVVVRSAGSEVSREEIEDIVKDTLCDAKRLRGGVYFVTQLPFTPSGKVLRRKVKEMAIDFYNNKTL